MHAVFRPTFGRILSGIIMALCAASLAVALIRDPMVAFWQLAPWMGLVAGAVWAMYWKPEVRVDDGGVRLVNVFSTVDIPWPAIVRVDTKWALTLFTAYGKFTAWAAPAPGGMAAARAASKGQLDGLPESTFGPGKSIRPGDIPVSPSGAAARQIRRHWEQLRDAGHLDNPRLESGRVPVLWNWQALAGGSILLVWGLLGIWLA